MLFYIHQSSQKPVYWVISTEDKKYIFSGPFLDILKNQIKSKFIDKEVEFIMVQQDLSINFMD